MLKKLFLLLALLCQFSYASFQGQIFDKNTMKPVVKAHVSDSAERVFSDENGSFSIDTKEQLLHVKAYGYRPYSFKTNELNSTKIFLDPITVKALYLTFWGAGTNSKTFHNMLELIDKTEVNAVVVDVKNEYGSTSYKTGFSTANSYGAWHKRTIKDINKFMSILKARGVYTIARIVVFKDELQASNNPDYAVKNLENIVWRNHDEMAWVDPFDVRSYKYTINIAKDAAKVGFDEVNFDYVRFPAQSRIKLEKKNTEKNRIKAIGNFLKLAQKELRPYGVFVSVDTYGNICWSKCDTNIGQTITSLAQYADYLCPMLYPSGFAKGSFYFKYPSEHPYEVIFRSIKHNEKIIDPIRMRPWLQSFQDYAHKKRVYQRFEIQEQIRATKDMNTSGWMLWSPSSKYHVNYLNPK